MPGNPAFAVTSENGKLAMHDVGQFRQLSKNETYASRQNTMWERKPVGVPVNTTIGKLAMDTSVAQTRALLGMFIMDEVKKYHTLNNIQMRDREIYDIEVEVNTGTKLTAVLCPYLKREYRAGSRGKVYVRRVV